jgi:hypothetical protein
VDEERVNMLFTLLKVVAVVLGLVCLSFVRIRLNHLAATVQAKQNDDDDDEAMDMIQPAHACKPKRTKKGGGTSQKPTSSRITSGRRGGNRPGRAVRQ